METLGEFVKLLLVVLRKKNIAFQMRNPEPWHALAYRLKRSSAVGKPVFFDDLWFDWDGSYPRSRELDELLTALHMTGTVETTSPHFEEWRLSPRHATLWEKSYAMLSNRERQFLDLAAVLAEDEFKKSAPRMA